MTLRSERSIREEWKMKALMQTAQEHLPRRQEGKARPGCTGAWHSVVGREEEDGQERTLDLNQLLLRRHHLRELVRTEAESQGTADMEDRVCGEAGSST